VTAKNVGFFLRSNLSSGLTFATLLSIGIWGHHTGWSLSHDHAEAIDEGAEHAAADASESKVAEVASPARSTKPAPEVESVRANGVIDYDQTKVAQLSAKVRGTVWRVEKKVGQQVRKGDVLAIIESADVGQAKSAFLSAVTHLHSKQKIYDGLHRLDGVVASRQIREAESALREAKISAYVAHQALVNLGLPIRIEDVEGQTAAQMWKRVQFLGLPEEMAAKLDPSTTTASLIPLLAPFDGTVLGRDVTIGEVVAPSQPQFIVADLREMWIRLDIRAADAGKIRLGQETTFRLDSVTDEIRGRVAWISTEVDVKTRTVEVRIDVPNPLTVMEGDGRRLLSANSFGTGVIQLGKSPMVDPADAVRAPEMGPAVHETIVRSDG
jgi:cobalt-zinc-cadmium efflux system membrane fusion protein